MHRSSPKSLKKVLNKSVSGYWCERTTGDGFFDWRKGYYGLAFWLKVMLKVKKNLGWRVSYNHTAFNLKKKKREIRLFKSFRSRALVSDTFFGVYTGLKEA